MPEPYRRLLDDLNCKLNDTVKSFQHSAPTEHEGLIYHYTNDVGLYQILHSGKLWMTDFTMLNDPKEIEYGLDVGRLALADMCASLGNPPLLQQFHRNFEAVANLGLPRFTRAFILSMSTTGDELSQWRAYANNATGYRIAFETSRLDQAFNAFSTQMGGAGGSYMVQYGAPLLRHQMDLLTGHVVSSIMTMPQGSMQHVHLVLSRISSYLMLNFVLIGLHFKHPAYQSEREFRYIITTAANPRSPDLLTRARNHSFIDYLELDWKNAFANALIEIMSGPAVDRARATRFMTETLLLHMPTGSTVGTNHSDIPYRA